MKIKYSFSSFLSNGTENYIYLSHSKIAIVVSSQWKEAFGMIFKLFYRFENFHNKNLEEKKDMHIHSFKDHYYLNN